MFKQLGINHYLGLLRISEVVALRIDDIDAKKGFIHVRCGKGGHERMAYLPATVLAALTGYYRQIYPKPHEWLFYGKSPDQQMKADTLRSAFNQARARAGISKDFSFHGLRHAIATHLFERGTERDVVQDILGHKSVESTRVYARTTAAMFREIDHPADNCVTP